MTRWLVTRHPGTIDWFQQQGIAVDVHVRHLHLHSLQAGDVVFGSLPIDQVAQLNRLGVNYQHLCAMLKIHQRGTELTAVDLCNNHARLRRFRVVELDADCYE